MVTGFLYWQLDCSKTMISPKLGRTFCSSLHSILKHGDICAQIFRKVVLKEAPSDSFQLIGAI